MRRRKLWIGVVAYGLLASVVGIVDAASGNGSQVAWAVLGLASLVVLVLAGSASSSPTTGVQQSSNPALQSASSDQKEPLQEAFDFAAFIGEGRCEPTDIYDVSVLPHPKERIEPEIMRVIASAARAGQADYAMRWHSMLDSLAQFQSGVGAKPVGVGALMEQYRNEPRVPGNEVELARRFLAAQPPEELAGRVEADKTRYREFMHAALGEKWEREMAEVGKLSHELLDQLGVPREERQQLADMDRRAPSA